MEKTTKTAVWLTNTHSDEIEDVISQLKKGQPHRVLFTSDPEGSAAYDSRELSSMGVVGIYELKGTTQ